MSKVGASHDDADYEEPPHNKKEAFHKEKIARKSFSKLRRELNDEESLSPGVQRMLIDEIDRLESQCQENSSYREKYHEVDKRVGVLEEKAKTQISVEIIHIACMTVGAAAIGYAPSIWSSPQGWISLVFGAVLVICGLVAKAVKL